MPTLPPDPDHLPDSQSRYLPDITPRLAACATCGDWVAVRVQRPAPTPENPNATVRICLACANGQARPLDEQLNCVAEPNPGRTYCAAAYLTYLEASDGARPSVVPAGVPVLCDAHAFALSMQIAGLAGVLSRLTYTIVELDRTDAICEAARAQAARVALRNLGPASGPGRA